MYTVHEHVYSLCLLKAGTRENFEEGLPSKNKGHGMAYQACQIVCIYVYTLSSVMYSASIYIHDCVVRISSEYYYKIAYLHVWNFHVNFDQLPKHTCTH